ncbi:MAG: sulfatase, partial [Phenylobacterium sp.]
AIFHFDGGSQETYAAIVTRMDLQIGRVLDALDARGLAEDTLVIFTSDNGGERFSDNWPFTGMKTELLEGGLRVPALLRWPGRVAAGTTCDQVTLTMDWMPTLLAAAGGSPHPDFPMDGIDLADALSGAPAVPRTLFWRFRHLDQEACRHGDWKYLKIAGETFLFDLAADPRERANLKGREPERYQAILELYRAWAGQMLPLDPEAYTHGYSGRELADHFGVQAHGPG